MKSCRRVLALVNLSFQEVTHERTFWIAAVVAIVSLVVSTLMGSLSFEEHQRMVLHFGMFSIHATGVLLFVNLGSQIVSRDLATRQLHLLLTRPTSRFEYFFSRWLSLKVLSFLYVTSLGGFLFLIMRTHESLAFFTILFGLYLEIFLVSSLALTFSLFLRPTIASLGAIVVLMAGHFAPEVQFFGEKIGSDVYSKIGKTVQVILPHFSDLNWRSIHFIETGVPMVHLGWVVLHVMAWGAVLFSLGQFIFRRKDLV